MSIDYRGLRLIEQVLEAGERMDYYHLDAPGRKIAYQELTRLRDLLDTWVGDKFDLYDLGDVQERREELLKAFRI